MKDSVISVLLTPVKTLLALMAGVFQLATVMFLLILAMGLAGWKILSLRRISARLSLEPASLKRAVRTPRQR